MVLQVCPKILWQRLSNQGNDLLAGLLNWRTLLDYDNIRKSPDCPFLCGIRGDIVRLSVFSIVNDTRCCDRCEPCRITHIGGRSTVSPAARVSSEQRFFQDGLDQTSCGSQQQIVLHSLKLACHGVCNDNFGLQSFVAKLLPNKVF